MRDRPLFSCPDHDKFELSQELWKVETRQVKIGFKIVESGKSLSSMGLGFLSLT